jgi:hypothetical protein
MEALSKPIGALRTHNAVHKFFDDRQLEQLLMLYRMEGGLGDPKALD